MLRGSDEPTPEQGLADQLVCCSVEPRLGVALALPDIDEVCEFPQNLRYWAHTGLRMELMTNDDNMAASGVHLGLQNRFW